MLAFTARTHNETFLLFIRISIRTSIYSNEYHMDIVRRGIYLSWALLKFSVLSVCYLKRDV